MTPKTFQQAMLVAYAARQTAYYAVSERRVRCGTVEQMKGVCYCIRNRVRNGWYDGDWIQVIENAEEAAAHDINPDFVLNSNERDLQRLLLDIEQVFFTSGSDRNSASSFDAAADMGGFVDKAMYWAFLNRPVRSEFSATIMQDPTNHPNRGTKGLMMFFD